VGGADGLKRRGWLCVHEVASCVDEDDDWYPEEDAPLVRHRHFAKGTCELADFMVASMPPTWEQIFGSVEPPQPQHVKQEATDVDMLGSTTFATASAIAVQHTLDGGVALPQPQPADQATASVEHAAQHTLDGGVVQRAQPQPAEREDSDIDMETASEAAVSCGGPEVADEEVPCGAPADAESDEAFYAELNAAMAAEHGEEGEGSDSPAVEDAVAEDEVQSGAPQVHADEHTAAEGEEQLQGVQAMRVRGIRAASPCASGPI
jgi:hypothetical protein